jgi:hypothetical protein
VLNVRERPSRPRHHGSARLVPPLLLLVRLEPVRRLVQAGPDLAGRERAAEECGQAALAVVEEGPDGDGGGEAHSQGRVRQAVQEEEAEEARRSGDLGLALPPEEGQVAQEVAQLRAHLGAKALPIGPAVGPVALRGRRRRLLALMQEVEQLLQELGQARALRHEHALALGRQRHADQQAQHGEQAHAPGGVSSHLAGTQQAVARPAEEAREGAAAAWCCQGLRLHEELPPGGRQGCVWCGVVRWGEVR